MKGSYLDTIESALLVILISLKYAFETLFISTDKDFSSSIMFWDDLLVYLIASVHYAYLMVFHAELSQSKK